MCYTIIVMKYQLAVFDLDGTILDTLKDLAEATNYALARRGFPVRTLDEIREFVGNGARNLILRACPEGTPASVLDAVQKDFTEYYKDHCADNTRPYEGIKELLAELRAAGIKTAVLSNKPDYGVQALVKVHFDGLFDLAMGERPEFRRKPEPDAVNAILEQLAVPRENAVYIGDSDVDVATAENAGLDHVIVTWGFRSRDFLLAHGAKKLAADMDELKDCLI